jgi:hypothetical protein
MTLVVTNSAKQQALSYLVGYDSTVENLKLKLYSNNYTPDATSVVAQFTEVTGGGYAEKTLTGSSWNPSTNSITYPQQTWTFTGSAGNVYGYYVILDTSGTLMFAEKFDGGPYNISTSGDIIRVTLSLNAL